ncbi:hypothetical protein IU500_12500 [Nocardia terpenica]|uniref:hypothetical protein n=1 Tax=Nocardia terpenica TaxID=455432 RepID=UPI001895BC15|nr:hypothetical protein [Nocardia terpenica]MBF6063002.1 hypothetical protein [Nocardia terpenica]MBF6104863.1 hypothetical protein [Nocardia terpenica]MBF6112700.1 hypothetical protein [Nocardia terpenica]MBF6118591.1 hypothetical protein [Nocardia terpenica]MBF6155070.1 hypothetical protein [Nocardia terpenica]
MNCNAWEAEYARLCDYAFEDFDNEFDENEARIVAQYWCEMEGWGEGFPALDRWSCIENGIEPVTDDALREARELLKNLQMHAYNWPHDGQPGPSIAAMGRVVKFLRTHL